MVRFGLILYSLQILKANIKNSLNGNKLFTEGAFCKEFIHVSFTSNLAVYK